jgi:hypothetical protein
MASSGFATKFVEDGFEGLVGADELSRTQPAMVFDAHGRFTRQCGRTSACDQQAWMEAQDLTFSDEPFARTSMLSAKQSGAGFVQCVDVERNFCKAGRVSSHGIGN